MPRAHNNKMGHDFFCSSLDVHVLEAQLVGDEELFGGSLRLFIRKAIPVGGELPPPDQASRGCPAHVQVDCIGLGGHDLGGPPYDICIRTDKHGQCTVIPLK